MKKNTIKTTYSGLFTAAIAQHFKKAARIIVTTDPENGTFTATDGYIVIRSIGLDYNDAIRPALQKDPESGSYTADGKTWTRTGDAPNMDRFLDPGLQVRVSIPAPFTLEYGTGTSVKAYYCPETQEITYFNAAYTALFPEAADHLLTTGRKGIAVLGSDCRYYAGLLPVYVKQPEYDRAVRAYFESAPADVEKLQREKAALIADRTRVEDQLVTAENIAAQTGRELNETRDQLEKALTRIEELETAAAGYAADLKEAEERAKEAEERADEKPADEKPALNTAGLEKLDGVTVIIKGATTQKPVAWISGDTKKHADALKAAGCKWSVKKSAWYLTA